MTYARLSAVAPLAGFSEGRSAMDARSRSHSEPTRCHASTGRRTVVGDHDLQLRVVHHERQAIVRVAGIQRHEAGSSLQDTQQRDHHVDRAIDAEAYRSLRPSSAFAQIMRQLIGALVQLVIRQLLTSETTADRIGAAARASASNRR